VPLNADEVAAVESLAAQEFESISSMTSRLLFLGMKHWRDSGSPGNFPPIGARTTGLAAPTQFRNEFGDLHVRFRGRYWR
jgi:hypothetical protein